jgi:NADH-quinone oxidoreductase subunit L
MEGPTPVSALLHAATMVTAGVLLLIKVEVFVVLSHLGYTIATVGVLTSLFAGFVALVQHDIKKIIAYSTCSQLGFMMLANGLGLSSYAFFHLITHAFFKALLFLTAGSVIHALNGEQDIRRMGGLQRVLPVTSTAFFIGTLAIVGFPYLSGYYSKELIFWLLLMSLCFYSVWRGSLQF